MAFLVLIMIMLVLAIGFSRYGTIPAPGPVQPEYPAYRPPEHADSPYKSVPYSPGEQSNPVTH